MHVRQILLILFSLSLCMLSAQPQPELSSADLFEQPQFPVIPDEPAAELLLIGEYLSPYIAQLSDRFSITVMETADPITAASLDPDLILCLDEQEVFPLEQLMICPVEAVEARSLSWDQILTRLGGLLELSGEAREIIARKVADLQRLTDWVSQVSAAGTLPMEVCLHGGPEILVTTLQAARIPICREESGDPSSWYFTAEDLPGRYQVASEAAAYPELLLSEIIRLIYLQEPAEDLLLIRSMP